MVLSKANLWVYNPKLFPNGCPVNNLWDLTDPKWKGKVSLQDPLGKPNLIEWFNQMAAGSDSALRAAYKTKTGKDLQTSEKTAAEEWVKAAREELADPDLLRRRRLGRGRLAQPDPAAHRPGVQRQVPRRGRQGLQRCGSATTLKPWAGFQYPKYAAIATKTKHPNAAKLFVHFILTQEGIAPELDDRRHPRKHQGPDGGASARPA